MKMFQFVPLLKIVALMPENGQAVFNSTENLYQIYNGSSWVSFNALCWPQPTSANAGDDQTFYDGTIIATLAANTPETNHGAGTWSIISGTGGSFTAVNYQGTTFTGTNCTDYVLRWTIATSCGSSLDEVTVSFKQTPTTANAGNDQYFDDGTTTASLTANTTAPNHGTGTWSIISGEGGSFADVNNPSTSFNGQLHTEYTLRWTISTPCNISYNDVIILFAQNDPGEILTDVDGNTYNTIWIGTQLWMAENLAYLPSVSPSSSESYTEPYYYVFDYQGSSVSEAKATSNYATYGVLYNWPAAMAGALSSSANPSGVQGVCPDGWHLPSNEEWTQLAIYHDDETGSKLKEIGTTHWTSPNEGATNESGFTALPGGLVNDFGAFSLIGFRGYWWSSTEGDTSSANERSLRYDFNGIMGDCDEKQNGFSVRCIKD